MKRKVAVPSLILMALLPVSCSNTPPANTPIERISGLQTVHCLMPSRVQRLGNLVYPSRRQLEFQPETQCTLRGGEFVVYDRASAASSAEFYSAQAEAGDAEAQYNLALVYESLFTPPRYQEAAFWYQAAADQNYQDAMKNLAYLYEQGLGVEQDSLEAIRLLRQSGGIMDDLVLASEMNRAVSEAAAEVRSLTAELEAQNQRTTELQSALVQSNQEVLERRSQLMAAQDQLVRIRGDVEALSRQSAQSPTQAENSADRLRLEELRRELASKEQQVSEQELLVASLEADLEANRAQLDASERRADLQEQRLQTQLANSEVQTAESIELKQALSAQGVEIASLTEAVVILSERLGTEQQQNRSLLSELQSLSNELFTNRDDSELLDSLLTELSGREQTIDEQFSRIQELERLQQDSNSSDRDVQRLENQLAELQEALQSQRVGYSKLEVELQNTRSTDLAQTSEVDRLLSEVARRGELISSQAGQIEQLEIRTAQTRAAMTQLAEANRINVEELDVVKAQLVATESDLVDTRSELIKHQGRLAQEELAEAVLTLRSEELKRQVEALSSSSDERVADLQEQLRLNSEQLIAQNEIIQNLREEMQERQNEVAKVEQARASQLALRSVPTRNFPSIPDFRLPSGTKRALVIGNDFYLDDNIKDLSTAVAGATAMAEILDTKYGFETTLLTNATRREIMYAFSELQNVQSEDDYVLIYYAGHGERSTRDEGITYWMPVDAQDNQLSLEADGIKSDWITNEVRAMKAKHVMIIADSCYAGAMIRPPRISVVEENIDPRRLDWIVSHRSRTVLTSGGNSPVLDKSVNGIHSVFTKALVELLDGNSGIIYGEALHAALVQMVRFNAEQMDFTQVPLYSEIAAANHGNGQFVFSAPDS